MPGTALLYAGLSPFGVTNDTAITWSNLQSSITAVGTITTGTWNGSVITGTFGGTGINNGASTITIGGNVAFSGAFPFTGTLTGSTNVTFPTSGILATITQTTTWIDASVSQTMLPQTGYKTTSAGLISLALPTTAAENSIIEVAGYGSGGFTITQGSGQQIVFCGQATTLGAGGSLSNNGAYVSVRLLCAVANTTWMCIGSCGMFNVV
jgi:hypothetical protein